MEDVTRQHSSRSFAPAARAADGIRGTLSPCTALRLYRVTEISCLRHEGYDAVSPTSHRTSFGAKFIGYRASRTPLATNFFTRQIAIPFYLLPSTFYLLPSTFYLLPSTFYLLPFPSTSETRYTTSLQPLTPIPYTQKPGT